MKKWSLTFAFLIGLTILYSNCDKGMQTRAFNLLPSSKLTGVDVDQDGSGTETGNPIVVNRAKGFEESLCARVSACSGSPYQSCLRQVGWLASLVVTIGLSTTDFPTYSDFWMALVANRFNLNFEKLDECKRLILSLQCSQILVDISPTEGDLEGLGNGIPIPNSCREMYTLKTP